MFVGDGASLWSAFFLGSRALGSRRCSQVYTAAAGKVVLELQLHYVYIVTLNYTNFSTGHYNYNYTTSIITTTLHYITLITPHYITLHYATLHCTNYTTLLYTTLLYTTLHYTRLQYSTQHYITLHYIHYTTLITPHHSYNCNYATLTRAHYNCNSTTLQLQLQLHYNILHPAVVGEVTTATIATTPTKKTQLPPRFGPSVDSLCHPCVTTTHLSYRVLFLKLPALPCAVLLVTIVYDTYKYI